jgi:hypothetical protein
MLQIRTACGLATGILKDAGRRRPGLFLQDAGFCVLRERTTPRRDLIVIPAIRAQAIQGWQKTPDAVDGGSNP